MPTQKRRKRSLRPENFHLEISEDVLYEMFKEANEKEKSDPDLDKLIKEYQKLPKHAG